MLQQNQQLKQSQKGLSYQIQLMNLIELPTLSFEQTIANELERNPALEDLEEDQLIDTEDFQEDSFSAYKTRSNNYSSDTTPKNIPVASATSFNESLLTQLSSYVLEQKEYVIAEFLIGSLDSNGYLLVSITDIISDLSFNENIQASEKEIINILKLIQKLEPIGIGARNLQECLLIQLSEKKQTSSINLATGIIQDFFDDFANKDFEKIMTGLSISKENLKEAIKEIKSLNPKPGQICEKDKATMHITPDFTVSIVDNSLELTLNDRNAPELRISKKYQSILAGFQAKGKKRKQHKEAIQFIKQKLEGAQWFISAIAQRQQTLYRTMNAIMLYQKEYFLSGDRFLLKPMKLKDISDMIQMDISTVSRAINSKYINTPYGTKLIKEFFSQSIIDNQGNEKSIKILIEVIRNAISTENIKKPLTDNQLVEILVKKGYTISRRRVTKYRDQLNIPIARLRKM